MITEIPLSVTAEDDDFTLAVNLDGNAYALGFSYSAASDRWYFDLYVTRAGQAPGLIVAGVGVCAGVPLLAAVVHPDKPGGDLLFLADADPARDDLGTAARLLYYDAAELAAIKAAP